jgi:Protein of unknown function (DUF3105)
MASRKAQKEKLRQERLERERAAAAAAARRRRMGYGVAGVLVVAVVAAVAVIAVASGGGGGGSSTGANAGSWPSGSVPKQKLTDLNAAAKAAGCTLQNPPSEGRQHTTGSVNYKTQPPTSGNHYPVPISDGAYVKAPPVTHIVHALEHGRVIYWFKPNAPATVRGDLHALYNEDKALVILLPDPLAMPYQVAATAWTHLLGCPTYNNKVPDAFRAFRDAYRLKGPEYFPNAE